MNRPIDCPLCGDLASNPSTSVIRRRYGAEVLQRSRFFLSSGLYLTPAPGTLTLGYGILSPIAHAPAFSALSDEARTAADRFLDTFGLVLRNLGETVVFEHGAASSARRGAACVDHAHLHLVPLKDASGMHRILSRWYEATPIAGVHELRRSGDAGPYIYLQAEGRCVVYETPYAESQLLRKEIARRAGMPNEWDWRAYPQEARYLATLHVYEEHAERLLRSYGG